LCVWGQEKFKFFYYLSFLEFSSEPTTLNCKQVLGSCQVWILALTAQTINDNTLSSDDISQHPAQIFIQFLLMVLFGQEEGLPEKSDSSWFPLRSDVWILEQSLNKSRINLYITAPKHPFLYWCGRRYAINVNIEIKLKHFAKLIMPQSSYEAKCTLGLREILTEMFSQNYSHIWEVNTSFRKLDIYALNLFEYLHD
jgi:hypothetical protein